MNKLQEKFDSAILLIAEHNDAIKGLGPSIATENFVLEIKLKGGTTEERLKSFSYEEILGCLYDEEEGGGNNYKLINVKPIALAKDIAKIFRGKEEEEKKVSSKKAEKMSLKELIENFDPEESESPIGKRLKEISKNEPFLVYTTGRSVNVERSLMILEEIKQGFGGRNNITLDGEVKEVLSIGYIPANYADENPVFRGRALRPDGTCDQTGRTWEGISFEIRQFIWLAIELSEINGTTIEKTHQLIDIALEKDALIKLKQRYRETAIEFEKLKKINKLPVLRIILSENRNNLLEKGKKVSL